MDHSKKYLRLIQVTTNQPHHAEAKIKLEGCTMMALPY